ncbi:hypothetical protein GCM10022223_11050 [Kineosporia mesophila]|uniref:DUF4397 domain-containing protein n=1 Tax=Kineosporia mesophila TaxID=566012 RepID=A0ABP6Z412_9ACTN|nr:DUF4397 domain-containing protein [Kineosporia mesophila]MCD5352583.1 DUF4397 domain-containing protein [Kineosporia mesophila]
MLHRPPRSPSSRRGLRVFLALTLLSMASIAGASASGASTGDAVRSQQKAPVGKAWVRVAHLVPGLGAARLDLQPTGGAEGSSIEMSPSATYGDVTQYQQFAPGTYTVNVSDSSSPASGAPMLSRSLTVAGDQAYTLAVLGTSKAPRLATLSDDLTPPAAGQARVRVLPAASQAPQATIKAQGGPTIVDNAVLGQASAYASVPAGTWRLTAGTSTGMQVDDTIKVAGGSVYTLVLLDGTSGTPRLSLITDAAGTTTAPKGGAATGEGGTAPGLAGGGPQVGAGLAVGLGALLVLFLVSSAGLARRRVVRG